MSLQQPTSKEQGLRRQLTKVFVKSEFQPPTVVTTLSSSTLYYFKTSETIQV